MNSQGDEIDADSYENNLAFNCDICEYPVLAVTLKNKRGSDENHPATCRGCGKRFFLDVRPRAEKLYIHSPDD